VVGADRVVALEIGDGASDFEDPVMGPGRQPQPLDRGLEEPLPIRADRAGSPELLGAHLGVAEGPSPPEPVMLESPGPLHPLPYRLGALPLRFRRKLPIAQRRDIDVQVDPVEEGPRDPGPVSLDLWRGTGAVALRVGEIATGTPMHPLLTKKHAPGRSVELLLTIPRLPTRTLGERIKCLRHKRGLHQKDLARLAGVDEMTIVRWEKDRSAPKGPRLTRLLRALDAQADELQADTGQDHNVSQPPPLVRSANVRVLPPPR
jgi:DNA-binding transcriptional regulator YiaG